MIQTKLGQRLIITIVRKEKAKKVIHASKAAGARGGTTLLGTGFRNQDKNRFLGIPIEREREIILTIVSDDIFPDVLDAIIRSVKLDQPKQGIGFVLDLQKVTGMTQLATNDSEAAENGNKGDNKLAENKLAYDLIVTIVNKGNSDKVVAASKEAGAEGGTIINGRGTGIHEQAKLFNILIEPEKEIILTLITKDKTADVLTAIEKGAELDKAGKGIAFVMEVDQTVGINHVLNRMVNEKLNN